MKTQTYTGRALHLAVASILAVGVGAFSVNSYAGEDTDNLTVSATLVESCIVTASPVVFGNYDPIITNLSLDIEQNGAVATTCSTGATGVVLLDQGQNGTGSLAEPVRFMKTGAGGATEKLGYQLYSGGAHTTVWGGTKATGKAFVAQDGTTETSLTVYGTLPAGQNKKAGAYTDTVVVTIDFT